MTLGLRESPWELTLKIVKPLRCVQPRATLWATSEAHISRNPRPLSLLGGPRCFRSPTKSIPNEFRDAHSPQSAIPAYPDHWGDPPWEPRGLQEATDWGGQPPHDSREKIAHRRVNALGLYVVECANTVHQGMHLGEHTMRHGQTSFLPYLASICCKIDPMSRVKNLLKLIKSLTTC